MDHPQLRLETIATAPRAFLEGIGRIFAVFDARTQDSGNVAYGVRVGGERLFVKTAGRSDAGPAVFPYARRVAALRNAARLWRSCPHPALARLHRVIESPEGPLLVYEWLEGELVGAPAARRGDPASPFQRLRALPADEILRALDVVYELHARLARAGWIAVDFYDGCLMYDFERARLRVIDLDLYRRAPFANAMGRMFGSSRFMAPEELELGARIDASTSVFTMGRTAAVLLSDGTLERGPFGGDDALHAVVCRACSPQRARRHASPVEYWDAWRAARTTQPR